MSNQHASQCSAPPTDELNASVQLSSSAPNHSSQPQIPSHARNLSFSYVSSNDSYAQMRRGLQKRRSRRRQNSVDSTSSVLATSWELTSRMAETAAKGALLKMGAVPWRDSRTSVSMSSSPHAFQQIPEEDEEHSDYDDDENAFDEDDLFLQDRDAVPSAENCQQQHYGSVDNQSIPSPPYSVDLRRAGRSASRMAVRQPQRPTPTTTNHDMTDLSCSRVLGNGSHSGQLRSIHAADNSGLDERSALLGGRSIEEDMSKDDRSTFSQSVINSVNLLVGLSLLSLPFTLATSGWVVGVSAIILGGVSTLYTSFLLVQCMGLDPQVHTLGDIGELAFGPRGRWLVSLVYVLELTSCAVSYNVVVGDSLAAIWPSWSPGRFRIIAAVVMTVSSWTDSLSVLSFASSFGLFASIALLTITLYDGFSCESAPGSLLDPAPTQIWPTDWMFVFMNMGLVIYSYSGHSVIPSIYRDMRNPKQFPAMIGLSYAITIVGWFLLIPVAVYLMFGSDTRDEFTLNLYNAPSYNKTINGMLIWLTVIVPTTKYALIMNPVVQLFEGLLKKDKLPLTQDPHAHSPPGSQPHRTPFHHRIIIRTGLGLAVFLIATLFPYFASLIGLVGALFSFSITLVFPCACHLMLFWRSMDVWEAVLDAALIAIGAVCGVMGTIGALYRSNEQVHDGA